MVKPPKAASDTEHDNVAELHDHFIGILDELPGHDLPLAREVYEMLTDSDDPRNRYWAATFYPAMIAADKPMGLSMLHRLIGREETEQAVQDQAYEKLSTDVAESDLLTFREGIDYVEVYLSQYRARLLERITRARGTKRDDHSRYETYPPPLFPAPGNPTGEPAE